jgi:hypothetical protein
LVTSDSVYDPVAGLWEKNIDPLWDSATFVVEWSKRFAGAGCSDLWSKGKRSVTLVTN